MMHHRLVAKAANSNPIFFLPNHFVPMPSPTFDAGARPLGVGMIHPVSGVDLTVRAWLLCGKNYTCHPIDVIDGDGIIRPLPTIRGLMPAHDGRFIWQLDTRRLMTVPMAEHDFVDWADREIGRR